STARVLCCGVAQLAALYSWMLVLAVPWVALLYVLLIWASAPAPKLGAGIDNAVHNLSTPGLAAFVVSWTVFWFGVTAFLLPAVGGRLLMRGVRPGRYPLWGITYLRFWFYGRIIGLAPLTLLTGTPLLPPFLRLLGAKVGRDCHLSAVVSLPFLVEI